MIAAFFDWDGTLSADGVTVTPAVAEAVAAFRRDGNPAFLCTGRAISFIPSDGLTVCADGIVAAAGAYVRLGDIPGIIAHFLEDGQICVLEGEQGMYVVGSGRPYLEKWPRILSPEAFAREFPGQVISKLTLYDAMSAATEKRLTEAGYGIIRHGHYIEVIPAGCSKSDGVRRMLEALGLSRESCWAFGDSFNDLDVLQYAGVGVALGNAPDAVKAVADLVVKPVTEDGVAHGLSLLMAAKAAP